LSSFYPTSTPRLSLAEIHLTSHILAQALGEKKKNGTGKGKDERISKHKTSSGNHHQDARTMLFYLHVPWVQYLPTLPKTICHCYYKAQKKCGVLCSLKIAPNRFVMVWILDVLPKAHLLKV
jgi:hypothetical protein